MRTASILAKISPSPKWQSIGARTFRLGLAFFGAYFLTAAFISVSGLGLSRLGMTPGEATYTGLLFGMFLFCGVVVWVAATRYPMRLSFVVIGAIALLNIFSAQLAAGGV